VLFSSPVFFIFFVIYFAVHQAVPARFRNYLIICGGTIFYAWWRVEYTWLPFFLTAVAFWGVVWMERALTPARRKQRATLAIVVLFLPLVVFKYTDFLYRDVIGPFAGWRGGLLSVPLPLGVSFITFTLCAYIVDTYKRTFSESHSGKTVLAYVLFFPHLIAGPILRPHELIPQLEHPGGQQLRRLALPLGLFTLGLVKKLVFADQIAPVVDELYAHPESLNGPSALLVFYGFAVQIYCDFSGYTDMALGLALMLGVRLPNNFFRPYAARSIVEFWRRWHVTLSFWLRDYLYIPLGGSRHGRVREARNIIVTMALGGLWHGANWTFVIWGLLHGVCVSIVHALHRVAGARRRLPEWAGVLLTFHVVTIAWVFFRAPTVTGAVNVLHAALFAGGWTLASSVFASNAFVLSLMVVFFCLHRYDDHRRVKAAFRSVRPEVLWPMMLGLWVLAIAISQGSSAKFIYFDF
jgi:D-alanyl-lipoteichoic acid acyltransferase DltB (MBOAT superfamily)